MFVQYAMPYFINKYEKKLTYICTEFSKTVVLLYDYIKLFV